MQRHRLRFLVAGLGVATALVTTLVTGAVAALGATARVSANSFTTPSCFKAEVKGVQSGSTTNSTNGTTAVSITSVDPTKAFLIFSTASNLNRPVGSQLRGKIASATTLAFDRVTDEAPPVAI